jgi:hypothetical protein
MLGIIAIGQHEREAILSWIEAPHTGAMPIIALCGRKIELRLDDEAIKRANCARSGTVSIEEVPVKAAGAMSGDW